MIGRDMKKNKKEDLEIVELDEIIPEEAEEYNEITEVEVIEEYDDEPLEVEVLGEAEDEPVEVEVINDDNDEDYDGDDGDLLNPKNTKKLWAIRIAAVVIPLIAVGVIIYCGIKFVSKMTDFTAAEKLVVVFEEDAEKPVPEPIVITSSSMPDNTLAQTAGANQSQQVVIQKYQYNYSNLTTQAPEAAGYLNVANTNIQYPVMWSGDDEFYLTHSSDGNPNGNGAIFLTSSNNPDFSDSTNYIFGHNMTNGLMFRSLNNYIIGGTTNYTYLSSHNAAYLVTPYETETYYIFYAEVIDPDADEYVTTGTKEDISARSGVDIPADAKMLILVTCYTQNNNKRVLVYGYKI